MRNCYVNPLQVKARVAIHHTVGGTAQSSIDWWNQNNFKAATNPKGYFIGTSYIIDRNGSKLVNFDEQFWAYQFGLFSIWDENNALNFERTSIGIELASEGPAVWNNGRLYFFNDNQWRKPVPQCHDLYRHPDVWRKGQIWDNYEEAMITKLIDLTDSILHRHGIPRQRPKDFTKCYSEDAMHQFRGVIGHAMVAPWKTDPIPSEAFWHRLDRELGLELVDP